MQPNDTQTPFSPQEQPQSVPELVQPAQPIQPPVQQPAESVQPELADDEPLTEVPTTPSALPEQDPVSWQAIEYIQHDKSPLWYLGFGIIVIGLMVVSVLFQAWTFLVLIIVMVVALMVYSHRPPRQLNYVWSAKGLYINDQLHPMGEFKGFGVIQDAVHNQLMLIPVKRFRPGLAVYFPSEVGEQLVDAVGAYLPMQELRLDGFDKIIQKLRI